MRASRATELAAEYPQHVAAAWCGHSVLVASKQYWAVRDEDYQRALATTPPADPPRRAAKPLHPTSEQNGIRGRMFTDPSPQVGKLRNRTERKSLLDKDFMGSTGLEPAPCEPGPGPQPGASANSATSPNAVPPGSGAAPAIESNPLSSNVKVRHKGRRPPSATAALRPASLRRRITAPRPSLPRAPRGPGAALPPRSAARARHSAAHHWRGA